jgi:hypothetical protein
MKKQKTLTLSKLHKELFKSIRDTASTTIDDPRAPRIIMEKFKTVGVSAIEETPKSSKDIPQIASYAINIIMIIADACEKPVQDLTLFDCVVALVEMAEAAKGNRNIEKTIARKIEGVCERFKNKKRWFKKVRKHLSSEGMKHLQVLPLVRPAHRSKKRPGNS